LNTRLPEPGAACMFTLNEGLFIAINERQMNNRHCHLKNLPLGFEGVA